MSQRSLLSFVSARLSFKVPMVVIAGCLMCSVAIGTGAYWIASEIETKQISEKLQLASSGREQAIRNYVEGIVQDAQVLASSTSVISGIQEFNMAWEGMGSGPTKKLQKLYIDDNPNKVGEKDKLHDAKDGSFYSSVHAKHHGWFAETVKSKAYYDIFLINNDGDIVYTYFKEADFATNVKSGEWAKTGLGQVYAQAMKSPAGTATVADFEPYAPSANAPAAFFGMPIMDRRGERLGVLAIQMPLDRINAVMSGRTGLGETGETLLVGKNHFLLADAPLSAGKDILETRFDNPLVDALWSGKDVAMTVEGYRGASMMAAGEKVKLEGFDWAVVTVMAEEEVMAPLKSLRNTMAALSLGVMVLVGALATWFVRQQMSRPLSDAISVMGRLSSGDTSVAINDTARGDEIGDINRALLVFRDAMVEQTQAMDNERNNMAAREARQLKMDMLIGNFRGRVQDILGGVTSAATQMDSTARQLTSVAMAADQEAQAASGASGTTSDNVQTVAAASEELAASIREISHQVTQATQVVGNAAQMATQTDGQVQQLDHAATKIGEIVTLIQSIAEQTNLLALNATIEAARAGEAGRGFAVVASEVKNLAVQTARATDDISTQISGIQSTTRETVEAIRAISATMTEVEHYTSAIAAAIEEQNAATMEISRSVQNAADGTVVLANNINGVSNAISETSHAAEMVMGVVGELNRNADEIRVTIDGFLQDVSAA